MKKVLGIVKLLLSILFYCLLFLPAKLLYGGKNIWLFCERGCDAKDNSYFLYKWLNERHPEINTYFIISKKSEDFNKIKIIGNYCTYKSLKHWLLFIASRVRLSTHLYSYVPENYLGVFFMKYCKKTGIDVFLQHGITYNFQDCFFKRNNNSNIIVCGSHTEYNYLKSNFDIGEALRFTGFPRFDYLVSDYSENRFILIQPTWRRIYYNLSKTEFEKTDYCNSWNSLLNNRDFYEILQQSDCVAIFNIHPSFLKFKDCFKSKFKDRIIIDYSSNKIQELLKSSLALITDYSSILFDYAYLKKPTIYYQFDYENFYSSQYKIGEFRIDVDGFGDVAMNEVDLISAIKDISKDNFTISKLMIKKIDDYFGEINNCCSKIYSEIINYEKKRF